MVFAKGSHYVSDKRHANRHTHTSNKVIKMNQLWVIQIIHLIFMVLKNKDFPYVNIFKR